MFHKGLIWGCSKYGAYHFEFTKCDRNEFSLDLNKTFILVQKLTFMIFSKNYSKEVNNPKINIHNATCYCVAKIVITNLGGTQFIINVRGATNLCQNFALSVQTEN